MDELASQQLKALDRVTGIFDEMGIPYWLFGGWAVDFHIGSITRPHDDLDLAIWLVDAQRISQLLEADAWRHAPSAEEEGGTGYERGHVRLELTFLVRGGDTSIITPLREGRVSWPHDALANDVRELFGVRSRVVGLDLLLLWKSTPRDDPGDAAKDRADARALSQLGPRQRKPDAL